MRWLRHTGATAAWVGSVLVGLAALIGAAPCDDEGESGLAVPAGFESFEHLVGGWKGTEVPTADRRKGVQVQVNWSWLFDKGKVVGMILTVQGSKFLKEGKLTYDPATKTYRLEAKDADGRAARFKGGIDAAGKTLSLVRDGTDASGQDQQVVIRVLSDNTIRHLIYLDTKSPRVTRFRRHAELGLTREGESFAANAEASRPRCIVTGGAATMTVSYQGRSYPVCCTGCQAEFQENPEKYLKKAAAMAPADLVKEPSSASRPTRSGSGGEFDDLVNAGAKAKSSSTNVRNKTGDAEKPAHVEAEDQSERDRLDARAQSAYRVAQALERAGNRKGARDAYRRLLEDFPGTAAAALARQRLDTLRD